MSLNNSPDRMAGLRAGLDGYPAGLQFIRQPALDSFHNDPGFYCHLLFVGQYAAPIFCSKHHPCWGGGVWLACCGPVHWRGAGWPDRFAISTNIRRQGPLLLGVGCRLWGGNDPVWLFPPLRPHFPGALALTGAADSVSTIIRNTIRQLNTPDSLRGRMTSINQIFFMGGPQLGEIEAGAVAQFFGVPFAIISGGIGTILGVWLVASIWPLSGQI